MHQSGSLSELKMKGLVHTHTHTKNENYHIIYDFYYASCQRSLICQNSTRVKFLPEASD